MKNGNGMHIDNSIRALLRRADQVAKDMMKELLKGTAGISTAPQFDVLAAVAANEGLSQTDLVTATGIDRSTMTEIVRRMVKGGLLVRKRSKQDARCFVVRTTVEGRRVLRAALPAAEATDRWLTSSTGAEAFRKPLERVVAQVGA